MASAPVACRVAEAYDAVSPTFSGDFMQKNVPIVESLRQGWDLTLAHFGSLLILALIYAAASAASSSAVYVLGFFFFKSAVMDWMLWGARQVFDAWLVVGVLLFLLHLMRSGKADYGRIFQGLPLLFWYLLATLAVWFLCALAFVPGAIAMFLCWLVMGVSMAQLQSLSGLNPLDAWFTLVQFGGVFLIAELVILGVAIIPPFYVSAIYYFVPYLVVDKAMTAGESLAASAQITKGGRMGLINFMVVCSLLFIAGVLALLIGLLFVVPMVKFATLWLYAYLLRQTEHQLGHAIGEPGILNAEMET